MDHAYKILYAKFYFAIFNTPHFFDIAEKQLKQIHDELGKLTLNCMWSTCKVKEPASRTFVSFGWSFFLFMSVRQNSHKLFKFRLLSTLISNCHPQLLYMDKAILSRSHVTFWWEEVVSSVGWPRWSYQITTLLHHSQSFYPHITYIPHILAWSWNMHTYFYNEAAIKYPQFAQ